MRALTFWASWVGDAILILVFRSKSLSPHVSLAIHSAVLPGRSVHLDARGAGRLSPPRAPLRPPPGAIARPAARSGRVAARPDAGRGVGRGRIHRARPLYHPAHLLRLSVEGGVRRQAAGARDDRLLRRRGGAAAALGAGAPCARARPRARARAPLRGGARRGPGAR